MVKEIEYYQDSAKLEDKKEALKTISERLFQSSKKVETEADKHACLGTIDGVDLHVEGGAESLELANENLHSFKTQRLELEEQSIYNEVERALFIG